LFLFFFNDTATTEIYTLPLHDALPIHCAGVITSGAHRPLPSCPQKQRTRMAHAAITLLAAVSPSRLRRCEAPGLHSPLGFRIYGDLAGCPGQAEIHANPKSRVPRSS